MVVITPSIYKSNDVLKEIHDAITHRVRLFPMLFQGPIPSTGDMWPEEHRDDGVDIAEHRHMVQTVKDNFCKLNMFPAPAESAVSGIVNQPHLLMEGVQMIARLLA